MIATQLDKPDPNAAEGLALIDQFLANRTRKLRGITLFPWQMAVGLMTAGAGFFAAGAAFTAFIH